jgi:hypothetical protein
MDVTLAVSVSLYFMCHTSCLPIGVLMLCSLWAWRMGCRGHWQHMRWFYVFAFVSRVCMGGANGTGMFIYMLNLYRVFCSFNVRQGNMIVGCVCL